MKYRQLGARGLDRVSRALALTNAFLASNRRAPHSTA